MSSISFDNAYLLFIILPLVALFTVPFALAIRKENANGHNIASMVMHVVMAVLIGFAAAGTSFRSVLTETDVYVVADVSYSTDKNLDLVDSYIRNLDLPAHSKLGVVCFGKDCEVLNNLGDPSEFESVRNATVDTSETNIAEALAYTGELFKEGVIKRIVLITDGKQTDATDTYAITRAVDGLVAKNIRVDAIYLDDNISYDVSEVQISSVDFTKNAYFGREETADVGVQSTYETDAVMRLVRGEEKISEKMVSLAEGLNNIEFDLDTSEEGTFDYKVIVEAEGDENPHNNEYTFTQSVVDDMRVLFVTGSWADAVAAVEQYGDVASIDVYEVDTTVPLSRKELYIEQFRDNEDINFHLLDTAVPVDIEQLCWYDQIVLANLDVSDLDGSTTFMRNVDTAVSLFGKDLVTMGNLYLQSATTEAQRALTDMLPVRYGNQDGEPKLYTLIVDSSLSMEHLFHLEIAKQLSIRLLDILNPEDQICIITFYGDAELVQAPISLENNRQTIINSINGLDGRQGTVIGAGLRMAYEFIAPLPYSEKQVMLITDGLNYVGAGTGTSIPNPETVITQMYDVGIATSVFDVGRQGDAADGSNSDPAATTAKRSLERYAAVGHGKYYYSNNLENLDEVTFGEISDNVTATVVEQEATVNVLRRTDSVLSGINISEIPAVSGYVYSRIKPSATTVLTLDHETPSGNQNEIPLFAYWDYGNGKVSTFTSMVGGENGSWLTHWAESGIEGQFLQNVFEENIPKEKSSVPYNLEIEQEGSVSRITVTPSNYQYDGLVTLNISTPDGDAYTELMTFGSNYYYSEIDSSLVGKYVIEVVYSFAGNDYAQTAVLNNSFAAEYDSFASYDPSELLRALNGRGIVSTDGELALVNNEDDLATYSFDLTVPLLIAVAVLFVVDVAVRKLKWEDIKSFFGFARKNKKKAGGSRQ